MPLENPLDLPLEEQPVKPVAKSGTKILYQGEVEGQRFVVRGKVIQASGIGAVMEIECVVEGTSPTHGKFFFCDNPKKIKVIPSE